MPKPRLLIYSVHVSLGFAAIEALLNAAMDEQSAWFYGNVYDPADGTTPLNWWLEVLAQVWHARPPLPAKDLDFSAPPLEHKATQPRLAEHSQTLMQTPKQAQVADVAKLMHLSEKLALLNYTRFQDWRWPQPKRQACPAIWAFNGDDVPGLASAQLGCRGGGLCSGHVRILSGLYGLLRPLDAILPYRLEMGTGLKTERGRDLYQFWGNW